MSSSNLPTCAFCTFINAPDSKSCVICKKSLHTPAEADLIDCQIKVCPECSYFNELSDNVCQMCGTDLENTIPLKQETNAIQLQTVSSSSSSKIRICNECSYHNDSRHVECQMCGSALPNVPLSEQDTDAGPSANLCSMCGKSLYASSEKNEDNICSACTYHNPAGAVNCLICKATIGYEQDVLNMVCPFCNHDNEPGVACVQCTFMNSIGTLNCVMCEEPIDSFFTDSSDNEFDDMEDDSMENDSMENDSMEKGVMKDNHVVLADVVPTATAASTPNDDVNVPKYEVASDSFEILESAPQTHNYFKVKTQPHTGKFLRAVTSNIEILKSSIPGGVWIKAYEDRMDLLTFMIEGPNETPYENGLFLFDIYLPHNFPSRPPKAHYISFWNHRLNPNLYTDGKVCVSLLGTWIAERKEEGWGPKSTLLQLIVSIQGLILVEEPYFNEPGTTIQQGTAVGNQLSAKYNEKVIEGMIKSTTELLANPPLVFKKEILLHFSKCGRKLYQRLKTSLTGNSSPTKLENFCLAIENLYVSESN